MLDFPTGSEAAGTMFSATFLAGTVLPFHGPRVLALHSLLLIQLSGQHQKVLTRSKKVDDPDGFLGQLVTVLAAAAAAAATSGVVDCGVDHQCCFWAGWL